MAVFVWPNMHTSVVYNQKWQAAINIIGLVK